MIYLPNEESYFESFSVTVEQPVRKVIRIQELETDDPDFELETFSKQFNSMRTSKEQAQRFEKGFQSSKAAPDYNDPDYFEEQGEKGEGPGKN